MGFSRQEYWSGLPFPSPGDLSGPGIEPRSPTLQADALPSEPPGKSKYFFEPLFLAGGKNTGVGCHSLLQEIFPTQGLNLGFLHYRQTLYCLSHQGSHRKATGLEFSEKGSECAVRWSALRWSRGFVESNLRALSSEKTWLNLSIYCWYITFCLFLARVDNCLSFFLIC